MKVDKKIIDGLDSVMRLKIENIDKGDDQRISNIMDNQSDDYQILNGFSQVVSQKADSLRENYTEDINSIDTKSFSRELLEGLDNIVSLRVDNLDEGKENFAKDIIDKN